MYATGLLLVSGLLGFGMARRGGPRVAAMIIALPFLAVSLAADMRKSLRAVRDDKETDAIVAILAHELRSPLATVRGAVDLLRRADSLDPARRAEVLDIAEETTRLTRIVDDAVTAVRAGRGELPLEERHLDLEVAVRDIVAAAATDPATPQISVVAQPGLPLVRGDETRVRQVVTNLLQNAIVHAGSGSTIILCLVRDGDLVRCTFHNDGDGISAEERTRLFRPFATARQRTTSMGMGLYISKQLVEAMGGAISYDTMPGQTATFWFTLLTADERQAPD
jgi:signal transduction histidine kinase